MKTLLPTFQMCLLALAVMIHPGCSDNQVHQENIRFFVGSSDGQLSHSIYLCELDPAEGSFAILDSFGGARGASYMDFSPGQKFLFAINQDNWEHTGNSSVTSFSLEAGSLSLEKINSQSSEGNGICHIHCSSTGDFIFAANYGSGHATALPIAENGEIAAATAVVTGQGKGLIESRQEGPHAHQVLLDPGQKFLLVPDLGLDKVLIYVFDAGIGQLTPNPAQPFFSLPPGSGPRHLAFHPDGDKLYIVNELNSTLTACRYNGENGTLTLLNTVSTVEEDHEGMKYPAAVRVHPNGKFVYASTRGENSCISAFAIGKDGRTSRIQVVEHVPNWPRDFNLDPSGRCMLVAGERSNEILLYGVDPKTGLLSETGAGFELPSPANVLFADQGSE